MRGQIQAWSIEFVALKRKLEAEHSRASKSRDVTDEIKIGRNRE
jgi:hypothetical protein